MDDDDWSVGTALLNKYSQLKDACFVLLNNIKNRFPEEDRKEWRCPDMDRIAKLIEFK